MENWDNYKLILALHRAGTIRGAAEMLSVNHATVSRRLVHINHDYNMPVFHKVTGGYKATALGVELVAVAESMEALNLAAERKTRTVNTDLSGDIRVSMGEPIAQFLLRDELAHFARKHSHINLTIETSIGFADLDRSEADIVIRATSAPPDHLVGRRLFPYFLCDYCGVNYLLETRPEDLRWLRFSKSAIASNWIENSLYPDAPVSLESDDLVWLLNAAKAKHGMIRTACYMADVDPGLVRLPGASPLKAQDLWVLTHPDLKNAPRIKYLMKYLASAIESKRRLIQGQAYLPGR